MTHVWWDRTRGNQRAGGHRRQGRWQEESPFRLTREGCHLRKGCQRHQERDRQVGLVALGGELDIGSARFSHASSQFFLAAANTCIKHLEQSKTAQTQIKRGAVYVDAELAGKHLQAARGHQQ
jgi:hypothetical protein